VWAPFRLPHPRPSPGDQHLRDIRAVVHAAHERDLEQRPAPPGFHSSIEGPVVTSGLIIGLDQAPTTPEPVTATPSHDNIRGSGYMAIG